MHARFRLTAMFVLAALLGGCALGPRLGWTATRAEATDRVRASCEQATRTLEGRPDHDTALRACLAAKTRQGLSS